MSYHVNLAVFEGPIDLLLHLITKQRVDIYDVSIATITDEYLATVRAMRELDLEGATGFLVIAATLLELKSGRLLPSRTADEDGSLLEERDRLLARLVEAATFRDAGRWIAARLEREASWLPREVGLEEAYVGLTPNVLAGVDASHVSNVASLLLSPKPQVKLETLHISTATASVHDAIVEMAAAIKASGAACFDELCGRHRQPLEVAVRFVALLELFKAGAVELSQLGRFGEIRAVWTGDAEAEVAAAAAAEYASQPEVAR